MKMNLMQFAYNPNECQSAHSRSDLGLRCPLTESMDIVQYVD